MPDQVARHARYEAAEGSCHGSIASGQTRLSSRASEAAKVPGGTRLQALILTGEDEEAPWREHAED